MRLNGKVRDYNVDHELAILSKEVADGQVMTKNASTYRVWEVLKGTNLVSPITQFREVLLADDCAATNFHFLLVSTATTRPRNDTVLSL